MAAEYATRVGRAGLPALALLCGCIAQYRWVDKTVMPTFDHTFIETIMVMEFANRSSNHNAGRIVADRIEELLVNESRYRVVPRQVLSEQDAGAVGKIDPKTVKKIGTAAGVHALVLGTVEAYEFEEAKYRADIGEWLVSGGRSKKVTRKASVLLYVKVVNTRTGVVAWSRSATGTLSWTGWPEKCSEMSPSDFLEKALAKALKEVKAIFPHRKKVRERIM